MIAGGGSNYEKNAVLYRIRVSDFDDICFVQRLRGETYLCRMRQGNAGPERMLGQWVCEDCRDEIQDALKDLGDLVG